MSDIDTQLNAGLVADYDDHQQKIESAIAVRFYTRRAAAREPIKRKFPAGFLLQDYDDVADICSNLYQSVGHDVVGMPVRGWFDFVHQNLDAKFGSIRVKVYTPADEEILRVANDAELEQDYAKVVSLRAQLSNADVRQEVLDAMRATYWRLTREMQKTDNSPEIRRQIRVGRWRHAWCEEVCTRSMRRHYADKRGRLCG